jgi:hypothetical protein
MVGAVTGTTSSLSSVSSSSSGSAALESQLAAKQAELADAKTEEDKTKINEEIAKIKSQLSALKTTEKQDSGQQQKTAAANGNRATVGVTSAEKSAPESKVPSEVMDVLMKMRPGGGSGDADKTDNAGPPDFSKLYSDMDSDDDGTVTKTEFVSASADRMSAEDAGKLFDALDSEKSGSISEDQFTSGLTPPAGGRPPIGPPPEGMTPPNQAAQQSSGRTTG